MPDTFSMVAEPNRRLLLSALVGGERSVGTLVTELEMTQPSVSKHLRVLREAGIVKVRQQAQQRLYSVEIGPLLEINDWVSPFIAEWNRRLDALGTHLDMMDEMTPRTQPSPHHGKPNR